MTALVEFLSSDNFRGLVFVVLVGTAGAGGFVLLAALDEAIDKVQRVLRRWLR